MTVCLAMGSNEGGMRLRILLHEAMDSFSGGMHALDESHILIFIWWK